MKKNAHINAKNLPSVPATPETDAPALSHFSLKNFLFLFGQVNKPVFALAILFLFSAMTAGYFYLRTLNLQKNPAALAQKEVELLVNEVGKIIELPEGETPTLATVTDPERLRDQPFFARAQKGNKVLIYTNARKAILYDLVAHRIIEVAPLNIGNAP